MGYFDKVIYRQLDIWIELKRESQDTDAKLSPCEYVLACNLKFKFFS